MLHCTVLHFNSAVITLHLVSDIFSTRPLSQFDMMLRNPRIAGTIVTVCLHFQLNLSYSLFFVYTLPIVFFPPRHAQNNCFQVTKNECVVCKAQLVLLHTRAASMCKYVEAFKIESRDGKVQMQKQNERKHNG